METERKRNPGTELNLDWIFGVKVNQSAVEQRTATLTTRRSVKKVWQAGWLLRAITCIDLTTLSGDDSPGRVNRLCAKARTPLRKDLTKALGVGDLHITTGAVCVYPAMVPYAVEALQGSNVPVASVATGFPTGLTPLAQRIAEIEQAVADGAGEIDIVITRHHVLTANWQALYDEIKQFKAACGAAHMKAILGVGDLATLQQVYQASMVAMMAGADFVKTSTGKETVNATLNNSLVMVRSVRDYYERTGYQIGFKPAGGLKTAKDAMAWQFLMKEELGNDWLKADLFRFGASSLLTDIERQLSHFVTGRYAARHHMPIG